MTIKTREDFEPEVTGFLEDSDGAIVDAYFGPNTNPEYQAKAGTGGMGIMLTIDSPDLQRPLEQWYSIGAEDNWSLSKDGLEVTKVKKPESHLFNKNSRGWVLVESMIAAIGAGDRAKGQDFMVKRDFYMTQAGFYKGLNFHWATKSVPVVGKPNVDVPMPVVFLGEITGGVIATSASTDDLDQVVVDLAAGLDDRGLKQAAMKNVALKADNNYMRELVSGPKISELEKAGKLTRGPDGKFI